MNRVRDLRLQAGMQQKELAVAVGVSRPTVSEWEHQKKDPTGERLKKLAELFGVSTSTVLGMIPIIEPIKLADIDFALSGELRDLSEAEKQDVLDYVRFKRTQRARQE